MNKISRHAFLAVALLMGLYCGSISFLLSLISGILIRRVWLAYLIGVTASIAITVYSYAYPDAFRFNGIDLKIHDGLFISGVHPLIANCLKNVFFAYLGASAGFAVRKVGHQTSDKQRTAVLSAPESGR